MCKSLPLLKLLPKPQSFMLQIQAFTFNPFSENTYLLSDADKNCWIIDPGMSDGREWGQLMQVIESGGLRPQAVFNTHAHIDHILGIPALTGKYNIPFALHPLDAPVLMGAGASALMFGIGAFTPPVVTQHLSEEIPLRLGEHTLKVLLTPGHSPGSVCFYNEKDGWVIGGDVLFNGSVGRTDLPGGHTETLMNSIRTQLYTLPDEVVVYPGHGPATTIGAEKKSNPFVQG